MKQPERSIRRRLTGLLLAGVGGLLVIVGVTSGVAVSRHLSAEFDAALLARARALATLTKPRAGGIELDFADELMPEFSRADEPEYFQLWDASGRVLERSRSLRGGDLPQIPAAASDHAFADLALADGRAGHLVQIDFELHADDDAVATGAGAGRETAMRARLVLARGRAPLDEVLLALRWWLAAATVAVMVLVALLARAAVGSGLRPLADLDAQIAQIDPRHLGGRLLPAAEYMETVKFVEQFNALLRRLEVAFERERQFSANAAHELRTPVAEIRNLADVALRWSNDPALAARSLREIAGAAVEMERLVSSLLALARAERVIEVWPVGAFDLVDAVDARLKRCAAAAARKRIALAREGVAAMTLRKAQVPLDRMLENLFANAIEYGPEGSAVTCTIRADGNWFEIEIANQAPGLEQADLEHMFEPLWRKDPTRADGLHYGLGLSVVRAYATQLGVTVTVALDDASVFRISLRGPCDDTDAGLGEPAAAA